MTKEELQDFVVENAGKMASGRCRTGSRPPWPIKRGKIIAFTIDQFGKALILLEDPNGKEKKDLPNPLSTIPFHMDGWYRVASPARLGFPVYADSVVIDEQVSDQTQPIATVPDEKYIRDEEATIRVCLHSECDTWCHRKYSGELNVQ